MDDKDVEGKNDMKPIKLALLGLSISAISFLLFYPASGIRATTEEMLNPNAPVWLFVKFCKTMIFVGIGVCIYGLVLKVLKK